MNWWQGLLLGLFIPIAAFFATEEFKSYPSEWLPVRLFNSLLSGCLLGGFVVSVAFGVLATCYGVYALVGSAL